MKVTYNLFFYLAQKLIVQEFGILSWVLYALSSHSLALVYFFCFFTFPHNARQDTMPLFVTYFYGSKI